LKLEEGGYVEVRAAEEDLVEVRGRDAASFARIAWHLGNRHLPAEIKPGRILIRPDHVIQVMLEGLGARLKALRLPFNPEGGAYAAPAGEHAPETGHAHGHELGHDQP
jgi:urease accessory protein